MGPSNDCQNEAILDALLEGPLTPLEALKRFSCFRLAARVHDLRSDGHIIHTKMIKSDGKRFAKYYLLKAAP